MLITLAISIRYEYWKRDNCQMTADCTVVIVIKVQNVQKRDNCQMTADCTSLETPYDFTAKRDNCQMTADCTLYSPLLPDAMSLKNEITAK